MSSSFAAPPPPPMPPSRATAEMEALLQREVVVPRERVVRWSRTRSHDDNAALAETLAKAFVVTGDKRFADKAKSILIEYAAAYGPMREKFYTSANVSPLFEQLLDESVWLTRIADVYDTLQSRGALTEQDNETIVGELLRPAAEVSAGSTMGLSNHKWWGNAAVGMVGYVIGDEKLVDIALNGEYGFKRHIGESVNDDGLLWEEAPSYHYYAMEAYLRLADAAAKRGADLFNMPCADRTARDGLNGDKTFKMMFDAIPYLAMPNGTVPPHKDSSHGQNLKLRDFSDVYAERFRDEHTEKLYRQYAAMIAAGDRFASLPAADLENATFGLNGRAEYGSSLFPSSGYAVLRDVPSNPSGLVATLTFGPYGGGHGHPDRLGFVLYAGGEILTPDVGAYRYGDPLHAEWAKQTVAHNTVVVGERSQRPMDIDGMSMWADAPVDTTPQLVDFLSRPEWRSVRARVAGANRGAALDRAIIIAGGDLVDIFDVAASAPTTFDYALHAAGPLTSSNAPMNDKARLGKKFGYQHLEKAAAGSLNGNWVVEWTTAKGNALRAELLAAPGDTGILAEGPGLPSDTRLPALLWRRKAAGARFIAVLSPSASSADPPTRVASLTLRNTQNKEIPGAAVVRLERGLAVETVVWNPEGETFLFDGVESDAHGMRLIRSGDETRYVLERFTRLKADGVELMRAEAPATYAVVDASPAPGWKYKWKIEGKPGSKINLGTPPKANAKWSAPAEANHGGAFILPDGFLRVEAKQ